MAIEDHTVSFSLEVNVEKAAENIRRYETVLYRALGLVARMGLPENVKEQLRVLQQTIAAVNRLRLAYAALQAARLAAGDPVAWGLAGIGVLETGASLVDLAGSYG